jgi:hypothetical protein
MIKRHFKKIVVAISITLFGLGIISFHKEKTETIEMIDLRDTLINDSFRVKDTIINDSIQLDSL